MEKLPVNNDEDLIRRLNAGEREAFVSVYEQYYAVVAQKAERIVGFDLAADATADVFIKLWNQPKSFNDTDHLKASLLLSIRHHCLNMLRSQERAANREAEWSASQEVNANDTSTDEIREEVYSVILREIGLLPPYLREIFKLAYLEGRSNAEIAAQLQTTDQVVRTKKSQALQLLRRKLGNLQFALMLTILFPSGRFH